jgi:hypothetical protein
MTSTLLAQVMRVKLLSRSQCIEEIGNTQPRNQPFLHHAIPRLARKQEAEVVLRRYVLRVVQQEGQGKAFEKEDTSRSRGIIEFLRDLRSTQESLFP